MKVAVTGKGGVGKTTLASTLARLYADEGRTVLAADVDPDANLGLALGLTQEEVNAIVPVSKMRELVMERTAANASNTFYKLNPQVSDLPDKLEQDVADLWRVYTQAPQIWTKQCTALANLCARSRSGGLAVSAPVAEKCARSHIDRLLKAKLISDYSEKGSVVSLRFRDQHVKRTLTRAGDLLELQVFLAARGEPGFFTDAVMGAKIDWKGGARQGGTMNEIDGLLMHGAVPVFVSCKLGSVPKEALYEVDSVAARFGGAYAVKALACSRLSGSESARNAIRQRARDMDILLIEGVDRLSRRALGRMLGQAALDGPGGQLRT